MPIALLCLLPSCGSGTSSATSVPSQSPTAATFRFVGLPKTAAFSLGSVDSYGSIAYAFDGSLYVTSSIANQLYIVSPGGQTVTLDGPAGAALGALASDGQGGFALAEHDGSIGYLPGGPGQTISESPLQHPYAGLEDVSLGTTSAGAVTTWGRRSCCLMPVPARQPLAPTSSS